MTATLKNNAFTLNRVIENTGHDLASTIVRDGHHKGTLFTWLETRWCVVDLEGSELRGFFDRIAVVTLAGEADAANGLNQTQIGCDMECGEWVVDAEALDSLKETYGELLSVIWEQK